LTRGENAEINNGQIESSYLPLWRIVNARYLGGGGKNVISGDGLGCALVPNGENQEPAAKGEWTFGRKASFESLKTRRKFA